MNLDPNSVQAHQALAAVFKGTGRKEEALKEISKALEADPENPRTLVWQAQIYDQMNRWADAERTFGRVLKQRPNYWLTYNGLGMLLNEEGRYDESLQCFKRASLAAPRSSLALNNVAAMQLKLGDFSEAERFLRRSIALKPSDLAYMNLALALASQGNEQEALVWYVKATELNPANDEAWLYLADAYQAARGKARGAHEAYQRAAVEVLKSLATNATDGPAWMRLALYRLKSGEPVDASSLIQKSESLGAGDLDSQLYKVRILELLGKREEALGALGECLRKGSTRYEVEAIPDLQSLRKDPRYLQMLNHKVAGERKTNAG